MLAPPSVFGSPCPLLGVYHALSRERLRFDFDWNMCSCAGDAIEVFYIYFLCNALHNCTT